jgi:outer membrane protein assembly factor BamB
VTKTHIAWDLDRGIPSKPSSLLIGDELYFVSDKGIAVCLDAKTGKQHWQQRLDGNFSASPLFADGRIHFFNHEGTAFVIEPSTEYQLLAINKLEGGNMASPIAVGKALFVRTETHLYRIERE